jgi:glycosyltransferase involved in cell wall biosynthesis
VPGGVTETAPLSILVATDQWRPDSPGGAARNATELALTLARLGHSVTVLAPAQPSAPRLERPTDGLTVHRDLPRRALPQTLTDPVASFFRGYGARPDVLIAHQSTVATGLAAAHPETPLVLAWHGSAPEEARFRAAHAAQAKGRAAARALGPVLAVLERRALARATRIVAPSEWARSRVAGAYPPAAARTVVIPCGVDTDVFSPGDGGSRIVAARRLEPHTGVDLLLRSLALLPGVECAVAGTGSLDSHLRALTDDLGLAGRVRFLGRLDDAELAELYGSAALAVLPSVAYESFGTATIEALACGTPVVGTPVGGPPELIAPLNRGLVSADTTPEALAAAIEGGLELAPDLRARCRAYAEERFSWGRVGASWDVLLRETAR